MFKVFQIQFLMLPINRSASSLLPYFHVNGFLFLISLLETLCIRLLVNPFYANFS